MSQYCLERWSLAQLLQQCFANLWRIARAENDHHIAGAYLVDQHRGSIVQAARESGVGVSRFGCQMRQIACRWIAGLRLFARRIDVGDQDVIRVTESMGEI